ncbi:MAG: enoyl-CoA hydratase/isomerase family protein [Gammaproteobacteria bacterium]|nr:enoyl-CoA hydratase/isomerase family protein [Gammaproteobacteria bacterium]
MNPTVELDIDARGVATVSLNRPDVNNAYDATLLEGLRDGVAALRANANVRVVVVRGHGRHFQAGADLDWLRKVAAQDAAANLAASRLTLAAVHDLCCLPLPTVALIHGACMGGGTGIAAACDIVIASSDARFAISEARWGLAATIIFPHLVAAIGTRQARRYAQSCEVFDVTTAHAIGLVHAVCEPGELDAAAASIIDHLLRAAPGALAETKLGVLEAGGLLLDDAALEALAAAHAARRQHAEAAEGIASFAERRDAAWYPGSAGSKS